VWVRVLCCRVRPVWYKCRPCFWVVLIWKSSRSAYCHIEYFFVRVFFAAEISPRKAIEYLLILHLNVSLSMFVRSWVLAGTALHPLLPTSDAQWAIISVPIIYTQQAILDQQTSCTCAAQNSIFSHFVGCPNGHVTSIKTWKQIHLKLKEIRMKHIYTENGVGRWQKGVKSG
jgi:hypothetical protein